LRHDSTIDLEAGAAWPLSVDLYALRS